MALSPEAFVAELDTQNQVALDRIAQASAQGEPNEAMTVSRLLVLALKHYRLIQKRLTELGVDTAKHDPLAAGKSRLLAWLLLLEGTVARVAAGQFTREALAAVRNAEFVKYCRATGDEGTARMYEETIQPDEMHHHELGRRLLLALATTEEAQAAAREASQRCSRWPRSSRRSRDSRPGLPGRRGPRQRLHPARYERRCTRGGEDHRGRARRVWAAVRAGRPRSGRCHVRRQGGAR